MAADEGETFGPWENADLQITTRSDAGVGADAGVPASIRFCSNIAKLMRRRLVTTTEPEELVLPAVFLLHPSPPSLNWTTPPTRVPMLDNGRHAVNGKIWFVGAGPGSGHFVPFELDDDDRLFRFVTDELGLGDIPAIIFDARVPDPTLRHYPSGLTDPNVVQVLSITSADVSLTSVCTTIDRTYREKMKTPDAQPKTAKLWKNASKWLPYRDAEHRVQMYLEIALNSAFPTCVIRSEQSTPEGRTDIEIWEHDPIDRSKITQHGVLELKVIRGFSETGAKISETKSKGWIRSGVEQAAAYRESKGAKWGALICFDMRQTNIGNTACFKQVAAFAAKCDVFLRRWFLYASSAQFRSASFAQND